jgi:hypothetical protein
MLRVLPIFVASGLVMGATLDRASEKVHGSRSSSNSSSSTSSDDDDDTSIFEVLDITTSTSELSRDGHEEGTFAGTTPAASRVAPAESAPRIDDVAAADLTGQAAPPVSFIPDDDPLPVYEVGASWAHHNSDVWRWGLDATAGVDVLGLDLRLDGWREAVGNHTDTVTLASFGIHGRIPLDGWDPPTCGLAWLGWFDEVGYEGGLVFTARWAQRWQIHLASTLEARIGNIGETSYQRYAALIGPTWEVVELQGGYEHVAIGGVLLGGPVLRCGVRF